MYSSKLRALWEQLGLTSERSAKRVVKPRNGWGIEAEQLENRALLSASGRGATADGAVALEVAKVHRKDPVVYPNVAGTWNIQVSSDYFEGAGTVVISQAAKGKKMVVTSVVTLPGFDPFTLVDTMTPKHRFALSSKSPRLDLPDVPIDLRLTISINFPDGNLNPTTFSGNARVIFVGEVGTFTGVKAV